MVAILELKRDWIFLLIWEFQGVEKKSFGILALYY